MTFARAMFSDMGLISGIIDISLEVAEKAAQIDSQANTVDGERRPLNDLKTVPKNNKHQSEQPKSKQTLGLENPIQL